MPLEFQSSEDKTINCKCPSCGKIISIDKTQLAYLNTMKYDIITGYKCDCGSYYTGTTEINKPKEVAVGGGSNNLLAR